jgi:hypothetical protein
MTLAWISAPVFRRCMRSSDSCDSTLARGREVHGLSAGHAGCAGGARQQADDLQAVRGVRHHGGVLREDLEGQHLQRVADQDRGGLVKARWQVGRPRRRSSSSIAGRSSCTSE